MPAKGLPKNSRHTAPDRLKGATNFSKGDPYGDPVELVKLLKSQAWIWDDLRRACDLNARGARDRDRGHWILAYMAFVVSRVPDIEPWLAATPAELWRVCGFDGRRRYSNVYKRFRELESVTEEVVTAAGRVVQHAKRHDSRVAAHTHVDGTEYDTNAGFRHVCKPEQCPNGRRPSKRSAYAQRVGCDRAQESRHEEAELPVPEKPGEEDLRRQIVGAAEDFKPEQLYRDHKDRLVRRFTLSNGCVYETLDPDAGVRSYGNRRFWHGYYHQKAIDHFTGGVLYAGVYTAGLNEHKTFPEIYDRIEQTVGTRPETITADRGFSVLSVFEYCTTRGTAPVIPWRAHGKQTKPKDFNTHDRHGIWRCKHCGSPTEFVRFAIEKGQPRTWVRCLYPVTDACGRDQSFYNKQDYRLLTPLWKTDPLYTVLQKSHQNFEGVHNWWRTRYGVAAKDYSSRPKIRSIHAHRLRSAVATLVEWVRICARQGWLGSARRPKPADDEQLHNTRAAFGEARSRQRRFIDKRMQDGLEDPYGEAAYAIGLTLQLMRPPSERSSGDDPPDADARTAPDADTTAQPSASTTAQASTE